MPPSEDEVSLDGDEFVVPEDPVEHERFKRRLMATANSLKKNQQQLRADCNAPDRPAGGRYSWRDLDWPHRSILVFSAHFVHTRAHPGATSRSVTHPDTTPS